MSKTLVIGATEKTDRYAYRAVEQLLHHNHQVVAIGHKAGEVLGVKIQTGMPELKDIDTVTLYVGPANQVSYYDYILSLKPRRVVFNPGTENPEFEKRVEEAGIIAQEACTLVMLSIGNY